MTDETINNCLSLAEKTFQQWHKTSFEERRELMFRAADLLITRRDDFITRKIMLTNSRRTCRNYRIPDYHKFNVRQIILAD